MVCGAVTRTGGRNRHLASHHASLTERRRADRLLMRGDGLLSESVSGHRRESAAHPFVIEHLADIGKPMPAASKRRKSIVKIVYIIDVGYVDVRHVDDAIAAAPSSIPRVEPITRSAGQPSNPAPAAAKPEAESKSPAAPAKSEEGNVSRGPDRIVGWVCNDRARPPSPATSIDKPPAVVIRRPAPRLVGHPRPAVVRFPNPPAIAIGSPSRVRSWNPHGAIIGNLGPRPIGIQILRTGVITIGVPPAFGAGNRFVAIVVPGIPVVSARRRIGPILRIIRPGDRDHLSLVNPGVSLRRGDFRGAIPHDHLRLRIRVHQNAIVAFTHWVDGCVGRIDFGVGLAAFQNGIFGEPLPHLHFNICAAQIGDIDGGIVRHAQNIRVIELKFGAGFLARGYPVARHNGSVQRAGNPLAIVASLRRDIAVNVAQSRNARLYLDGLLLLGLRVFRTLLILGLRRSRCKNQKKHCEAYWKSSHGLPPNGRPARNLFESIRDKAGRMPKRCLEGRL